VCRSAGNAFNPSSRAWELVASTPLTELALPEAVLDILTQGGVPMGPSTIQEQVSATGREDRRQSMGGILQSLKRRGEVEQVARDRCAMVSKVVPHSYHGSAPPPSWSSHLPWGGRAFRQPCGLSSVSSVRARVRSPELAQLVVRMLCGHG
jgi:hypothetical protein